MKKRSTLLLVLMVGLVLFLAFPRMVPAQGIKDAVEELTGNNGKGYLQPLFDSFANNLNSGIYTSAAIPRVGLHLRLNIVAMGTIIRDKDRTFTGVAPTPYSQKPVKTATVFGDKGAVVDGPGVSYHFQSGQIAGDFFPFAVPQLEIGSILGTIARVRFFSAKLPGESGNNLGTIKLIGYGIQHSLSQYIPFCPVDISAGFLAQSFDIGDIMKCKTLNLGLQVSKSFSMLMLFGGANFESGTMKVSYDYQGKVAAEKIKFELDSKTSFRFHMGAGLNMPGVFLSGAIYLGPQLSTMVGVGFGI
jgi:hypothetical protein